MAVISWSSIEKIPRERTGHAPYIAGGPGVTAAERESSEFVKLRVTMATTGDSFVLPTSFGNLVDWAVRSVTGQNLFDITYTAETRQFDMASSPAAETLDIWLWFR